MVVLLLSVEMEIMNELAVPEREKLMLEVSLAYRDRSRWQKELGRSPAADADLKRAEQLDQEARKLAKGEPGQIEMTNRWREAINLVIDGVSYRLAVGETKVISRPAGQFRYELPSTGQVSNGQVEAGKTFRLQIQ